MLRVGFFKNRILDKRFFPALVLVFNSLVWNILSYSLLSSYVNHDLSILGSYFVGVAFAAILGASLFRRSREVGLSLWMLLSAAMTALLPLVASNSISISIFITILFGVSTGIGLPSSLGYFADVTNVENRGTLGGIIWGAVGFGVLTLALSVASLDTTETFGALALWRFFGFVAFFLLWRTFGKISVTSVVVPSYRSILGRREMVLYLLPWVMFSLVNFAEAPIVNNVLPDATFAGFVEFAVAGFFAIVAGMLADIVGRKRVIITGFVLLGIDYAVFGLFSGTQAIWYVYTVLDGIAWGMFAAVFFMTVWGDLAGNHQKERYYLLGGLPYLLAAFLSEIVTPFLAVIPAATAFSLASFFLFVAVVPLMYATDTLSEKRIKEMELRNYLQKAKKVKEKYA